MTPLYLLVVVLNAICVALYGAQAIAFERNRGLNAALCGIWIAVLILNLFTAFRH